MDNIVLFETIDNIATITIDDGKANAVSPRFVEEVNAALDQAEADNAVVVLTGRPGKFSAGFDLSTLSEGGDKAITLVKNGGELMLRLLAFPTPVVIACNGHCMALGALFLLAADFRIGVEGNFKIGLNEVAIGMALPYFGVEIARERLPHAYFGRSVANAEIFTPQTGIEAGFLDAVVPEDLLMETAMQKALSLSGLNMAAYQEAKMRVRGNAVEAIKKGISREFGN